MNPIYLKTSSHRAREKLVRFLGRKPDAYYTWPLGGVLVLVTAEELARLQTEEHWSLKRKYPLGIAGLTRYRGKEEPARCWPAQSA